MARWALLAIGRRRARRARRLRWHWRNRGWLLCASQWRITTLRKASDVEKLSRRENSCRLQFFSESGAQKSAPCSVLCVVEIAHCGIEIDGSSKGKNFGGFKAYALSEGVESSNINQLREKRVGDMLELRTLKIRCDEKFGLHQASAMSEFGQVHRSQADIDHIDGAINQ